MSKKFLLTVGAAIIVVVLGVGGYFFLIPRCPASCDDGQACTLDVCSEATGHKCANTAIPNCCGNKICETGETYQICAADCPNCDDDNKCTKDSYDYYNKKCANKPLVDVACCGNAACELGETYQNCTRDCPNCDDADKCTKDSYEYHRQKCLNEIIVPCCGNGRCDKGAETRATCAADCPNCDDNNKLTTDSFNYDTQKCANVLTHYFFDDFEAGAPQGWDFLNAVDSGPANPGAWTLIREGSNTVLKGVNHNFADISGKGWDNYILKFKFKIVRGSAQINFRNNFFVPTEITRRYMIRLGEGGGRLTLAKGFNEQKGIYEDLEQSAAAHETGWHILEVRSYQDIINVYLDGDLLIKYKDIQNPFLSGKVNFETGDDSTLLFDNVEIKLLQAGDVVYP